MKKSHKMKTRRGGNEVTKRHSCLWSCDFDCHAMPCQLFNATNANDRFHPNTPKDIRCITLSFPVAMHQSRFFAIHNTAQLRDVSLPLPGPSIFRIKELRPFPQCVNFAISCQSQHRLLHRIRKAGQTPKREKVQRGPRIARCLYYSSQTTSQLEHSHK